MVALVIAGELREDGCGGSYSSTSMMRNPAPRFRHSLRLQAYDYASGGAYVVTICTQHRACRFGDVIAGSMRLNECGQQIAILWEALASRFSALGIDFFVVMPNHLHAILVLPDADGKSLVGARGMATRLSDVVGAFKWMTTVAYIEGVKTMGWPQFRGRLWRRNYYEHVVRDETELTRIPPVH
jgi:REP element-mobilizing transposase RayT